MTSVTESNKAQRMAISLGGDSSFEARYNKCRDTMWFVGQRLSKHNGDRLGCLTLMMLAAL
jgi:hypothetical protein